MRELPHIVLGMSGGLRLDRVGHNVAETVFVKGVINITFRHSEDGNRFFTAVALGLQELNSEFNGLSKECKERKVSILFRFVLGFSKIVVLWGFVHVS